MNLGVRLAVLLSSVGLLLTGAQAKAGPEIRATAALAQGKDPSGQKAAAMADALLRTRVARAPGLRLIEPGRALSGDPRTREEEILERARAAFADGKKAYDALALDDAIARLGQAVSLYQRAGPLLGDLGELRSALAHLAASLVLRGSADEAESTFVELLTIDPSHELSGFPSTVDRVFERAAARLDALPSGSVEIYSTPPYAAVHLDGRFEGVTPLVLDDVIAGTHYIRLEKLGYTVHGAPLEIAPKQRLASQTRLASLVGGAELRDVAARSADEVGRGPMGGSTRELARTLVADTLIIVVVTQSGRDASFVGEVYDAPSGRRLGREQTVLSADAATFTERLGRYLDRLVDIASAPPSDPAIFGEEGPSPGEPAFGLGAPPGAKETFGPALEGALIADPPRASATPSEVYLGATVAGLGVASLITGAVFGILAWDVHEDFRSTSQRSPDLAELRDRGEDYSLFADVAYGVGGGLVAVGGTIVLLAYLLRSPAEQLAGAVAPVPGGAVVGLGGAF